MDASQHAYHSHQQPGPLSFLSGGLSAYPHSFSAAQMQSLVAVFDTFVPSITISPHVSQHQTLREACSKSREDEIQAFYDLSASQADVPSYAAGLMQNKLPPVKLQLVNWILWLLSSRLGTYVLCGRASLSGKFPYFRSLAEIPVPEREKLFINAWSHSPSLFYRTVFNACKIFSLYCHYTKVDEKGQNPTWNAIGYCGPDPAAVEHRRKAKWESTTARKPLEGKVLDAELLDAEALSTNLEKLGFTVMQDVSHLADLWPEKARSKHRNINNRKKVGVKCDAVVVGSGSGGGVVAGVLAKAGFKVVVLEKGKYFAGEDLSLLEGPTLDNMYEGGGILPTDNLSVLILAGATVGGGSTINWSASFRTPEHILTEWATDNGLELFSSNRYVNAMDVICQRLGVQPDVGKENFQNEILRRGCRKLGFKVDDVCRNCGPDHACGWCGFGCWSRKKQSTAETWLVDAAAAGSVIIAGCQADSVLLRENVAGTSSKPSRAAGVVATFGENLLFIESAITVSSCGSLLTPLLLQRSGLVNPNIGKNLHLHPVQMMWGYFPPLHDDSTSYEGGIITAISPEFAKWHPGGHGCILQCPSLHPGVFSVLAPWLSGLDSKLRMRRFARTAHVFALARDRGVGVITPTGVLYDLHPDDHTSLLDGGEAALRVLIAAGATEVGTHHRHGDRLVISPTTTSADVDAFLSHVRSQGIDQLGTPLCSAHQMGSCRMGTSPTSSAIDPQGESWEVACLFVADASVFPSAIGVNPMVTIQSIAYCIAHSAVNFLRQNAT